MAKPPCLAEVKAHTSQNFKLIIHPISSCFVARTLRRPFAAALDTFARPKPFVEGLLTDLLEVGLVVGLDSLPLKLDFHFEWHQHLWELLASTNLTNSDCAFLMSLQASHRGTFTIMLRASFRTLFSLIS